MALQLGNSTINDIINEINQVASNASSNTTKIQLTIDSMTANTPLEKIVTDNIPADEDKIAFISFSNDTNAIALDAGITLKSIDVQQKKFTFVSNKDVTIPVKVIVTFI